MPSIPSTDDGVAKVLSGHAGYMKAVTDDFSGLQDDCGPSADAAVAVAAMFRRFHVALQAAPAPSGLSEDELELYQEVLREQCVPLEEQARSYEQLAGLAEPDTSAEEACGVPQKKRRRR